MALQEQYDILTISETWFNSTVTKISVEIKGYQLDRSGNTGVTAQMNLLQMNPCNISSPPKLPVLVKINHAQGKVTIDFVFLTNICAQTFEFEALPSRVFYPKSKKWNCNAFSCLVAFYVPFIGFYSIKHFFLLLLSSG